MYRRSRTAIRFCTRVVLALAAVSFSSTSLAWAQEEKPDYDMAKMEISVAEAIDAVTTTDPGMQRFFDDSYGYAVFPNVGKGGFVVGGAHGNGLVYEGGELIGSAVLKQVSVGLQAGGQSYIEVLFFQGEPDLQRFKENKVEFGGQASAVAVKQGASADIDYAKGVAVITHTKGGLMAEASLGGQKFEYKPLGE